MDRSRSHGLLNLLLLAPLAHACAADRARGAQDHQVPELQGEASVKHVLLLSVDGLHASDLADYTRTHESAALARLAQHGVIYQNAWINRLDGSPTNPSDSFPGLLALLTGGSSRTTGVWYDVSYARELYPDATCTTAGTAVAYDDGADVDSSGLWGDAAPGTRPTHDPEVVRSRLDLAKLPYRKTTSGCTPVYPHDFLRVNTVFEVVHGAGLHTAWSDKHLVDELVSGPSGAGLDDLFVPEINSAATNLPGTGAAAGENFTAKPAYAEAYDDFKVSAILREIRGEWSDAGLPGALDADTRPGVPALFGMNFQALSVAQKDATSGRAGYRASSLAASAEVEAALEHTDASIGAILRELEAQGLLGSTLLIISAKHGQSPIDPTLLRRRDGDAIAARIRAGAKLAAATGDDVGLYWLFDSAQAARAVAALQAAPSDGGPGDPSIERLFSAASPGYAAMFGDPALDPRTPDLVVQPRRGVIYSVSPRKLAEHGGFAEDDAHVALLLSHPAFAPRNIDRPVRTAQVAPTVLAVLGLDPNALVAVRRESIEVLPAFERFARLGH